MSSGRTILLAEDDDLVRQIAQETLSGAGFHVVSVADGQAAIEALPLLRPDLILSDVRMPRCDGFEFLRHVRQRSEDRATPFIIISAKADTTDQRTGMSMGADDYVTKPFQPDDLLKTISARLERSAIIREAAQQQQRFLGRVLPYELRTPLTGIIGYADLMVGLGESGTTLAPAELADYGRNLRQSGYRLLRIAESLTLWSRLENCHQAISEGQPAPMIQEAINSEEIGRRCREWVAAQDRSADVEVSVADGTVSIPGEGLEIVMEHLVENACKYSEPGTPLRVLGRPTGGGYEFVVVDQGRGMTLEELETAGVRRQVGGVALAPQGVGGGLAVVRSFAELGGGSLRLFANSPEPGVTARLFLLGAPSTSDNGAG
jgi:two-component system sensor histidine kinase/response regulator